MKNRGKKKTLNWIMLILILGIFYFPSLRAESNLSVGLIGYWPFNEGSGNITADISGKGNNGSLVNGPTWVEGKVGNALRFDGVNDLVEILDPNDGTYDIDSEGFTVSVWAKLLANGDEQAHPWSRASLVNKINEGDTNGFELNVLYYYYHEGSGSIWYRISSGGTAGNITDKTHYAEKLGDHDWHLYTLTYNSSEKSSSIYLDARLIANTINENFTNVGPGYYILNIGSRNRNYLGAEGTFNGSIDEVRFYNRSINIDEIRSIYYNDINSTFSLYINIKGNGSVNVSGNLCSDNCTFEFDSLSQVNLSAIPDNSFNFSAWKGDCSGNGTCEIVMDHNKGIAAEFISGYDNSAPVLSNGTPLGALENYSTAIKNISLITNENATCKYAEIPRADYNYMHEFIFTGGKNHTTTVSGLQNGRTHTFFIKCQDIYGNTNPYDYLISVSIAGLNSSRVFYISTTGNDSDVGNFTSPKANASVLSSSLIAGDVVFIMPGTYDDHMQYFTYTGDNWSNPITISAYDPNNRPIWKPTMHTDNYPVDYYPAEVIRIGGFNKYILFDGLILDATNLHLEDVKITDNAQYIRFQNCELKNAPEAHGALVNGGIDNNGIMEGFNEFFNCDVHDTGYRPRNDSAPLHGFYVQNARNTFSYSRVWNNSDWGFHMYSGDQNGNLLHDNIIYNNENGILFLPGKDGVIYNNIIHDNPGNGISLGITDNVSVYHNTLFNNGGGIRSYSCNDNTNLRIINNLIFNHSSYSFAGIYFCDNSSSIELKNNLVSGSGVLTALYRVKGDVTSGKQFIGDNYQPLFYDIATKDARLLTYSPAIQQGYKLTGVEYDIAGARRSLISPSIGAYEIGDAGASWFASPSGNASGDGSILNPWDLQTALDGGNGSIMPGDTVWLRNGTYSPDSGLTFESSLLGAENNPITFRPYPNEHANIKAGIYQYLGGFITYRGLEVSSANNTSHRVSAENLSFPADIPAASGFSVIESSGIKIINNIIHDNIGNGIYINSQCLNAEVYGNIIYHNGWDAPDRTHGHNLYLQNNESSTMIIENNIDFSALELGIQAYGSGAPVKNITFKENILFNNDFLLGAGTPEGGMKIIDNTFGENSYSRYYYNNKFNQDLTVINNSFVEGAQMFWWNPVFIQNNTFYNGLEIRSREDGNISQYYIDNNCFYSTPILSVVPGNYTYSDYCPVYSLECIFDAWQSVGFDTNGSYYTSLLNISTMKIKQNQYDSNIYYITILNWPQNNSISINISNIVSNGENYEIRDAQNYYAPIINEKYSGGLINIPLNLTEIDEYIGDFTGNYHNYIENHTSSNFGVFILQKIDTLPEEEQQNNPPSSGNPRSPGGGGGGGGAPVGNATNITNTMQNQDGDYSNNKAANNESINNGGKMDIRSENEERSALGRRIWTLVIVVIGGGIVFIGIRIWTGIRKRVRLAGLSRVINAPKGMAGEKLK